MVPRGMVKHSHDKDTGVVVQRVGAGLVVRILKIRAEYQSETPTIAIRENARQFVSVGPDRTVKCEKNHAQSKHYHQKVRRAVSSDVRSNFVNGAGLSLWGPVPFPEQLNTFPNLAQGFGNSSASFFVILKSRPLILKTTLFSSQYA